MILFHTTFQDMPRNILILKTLFQGMIECGKINCISNDLKHVYFGRQLFSHLICLLFLCKDEVSILVQHDIYCHVIFA